jgi:hypothetical protein
VAEPVIAEFTTPEGVIAAARRVRELGYRELEAYTPFPIPELEAALAIRRTRLPFLVFVAGATGAALAYLLLWWTNAHDYRLNVGGRPYDSVPTDIPIMFETTVLFAGGTAFLAALVLSGLPRLHHRVFELEGFERTTLDRFWLTIGDARTIGADVAADELGFLRRELVTLGAVAIRGVTP